MDKKLTLAKTYKKLEKQVQQIINNTKELQITCDAYANWLKWFRYGKQYNFLRYHELERFEYYRAFVVPAQNFYAVQVWERHPKKDIMRCVTTLNANKLDTVNWCKGIFEIGYY